MAAMVGNPFICIFLVVQKTTKAPFLIKHCGIVKPIRFVGYKNSFLQPLKIGKLKSLIFGENQSSMERKDGLLSMNVYAKRIGVSHTLVQKALKQGKIIRGYIAGKIDPYIANQEWGRSYIPEFKDYEPDEPAATNDTRHIDIKKKENLVQKAQQTSAILRSKKLQLEVKEKEGKLIDRERANLAMAALGQMLRQEVLSVPARVIDLIMAVKDRDEAYQILYSELEMALRSTSDLKIK